MREIAYGSKTLRDFFQHLEALALQLQMGPQNSH